MLPITTVPIITCSTLVPNSTVSATMLAPIQPYIPVDGGLSARSVGIVDPAYRQSPGFRLEASWHNSDIGNAAEIVFLTAGISWPLSSDLFARLPLGAQSWKIGIDLCPVVRVSFGNGIATRVERYSIELRLEASELIGEIRRRHGFPLAGFTCTSLKASQGDVHNKLDVNGLLDHRGQALCFFGFLSLVKSDHVNWDGELTSSRVRHRYMPIFVLVLL